MSSPASPPAEKTPSPAAAPAPASPPPAPAEQPADSKVDAPVPPPTTVVVAAPPPGAPKPAPQVVVVEPAMDGEWENGLFSHCLGGSFETCLGSWFCPCFVFGRASKRLEQYPRTKSPRYVNPGCMLYTMCLHHSWVPIMAKRGDMREHFGIAGSEFKDCAIGLCCQPCAIAQMETEVKSRAEKAVKENGYEQQPAMQYAAPPPAAPPAAAAATQP